mmetsp:Transcript_24137/g.34594  ORF Transcript_24137/g.34594 Transcript_24137/m.34594 type:complete len:1267 (+) Transcript_24137:682-4482(+)
MAWRWVHGRAYLMSTAECPGQLLLTSGSSETLEEVPRLEPTTSYRTLGVHLAVTGSMKKALQLQRQKSSDYAGLISNSTLNRCEAYFSFVLYFYPKISYSLPVTTFTQKECTYIQAPAMSAFLSKIGLNRHTSRTIVHGPATYGGLGIPDVYSDQGIGQLRLLLGHLRNGDQTSQLLTVAITIMQQRVGSSVLFFNLPYPKYVGWVEKTWLTSLWQFLHITNLKLNIPSVPLPSKQRTHDVFLMSDFIYKGFKKRELELINQCRLYHQVVTLADIMVADGTAIDPAFLGTKRHEDRVSTLQWPIQNCPSPKAWRQWNTAIQYLLYKGKLIQPLGVWTKRPHQQWGWVVRLSDMVLFHKHQNGWEKFSPEGKIDKRTTRKAKKPWYFRDKGSTSLPPEGIIAAVTPVFNVTDGDLFTVIWSEPLPPRRGRQQERSTHPIDEDDSSTSAQSENIQMPQLLPKFLENVEASEYFRRLVGPIQYPSEADILEIITNIISGTLLVCSDGSFSPHSGTGSHAWVFATAEGQALLQGAGPIDCHPEHLSSYRPELGGITSLLFLLTVVVRLGAIANGQVKLYCDNKSALENVFEEIPKRGIYPLLAVDYDLLVLAKDLLKNLPIKVSWGWVKGHYSGDNRQVQHDLNALVDTLATQFRQDPAAGYEPTAYPMFHPLHKAAVYIDGSMVTKTLSKAIYEQRFQVALMNTVKKRAKWTEVTFQNIDWDIFGKVFKSYSRFHQISIAKFVHGLWNTGEQKVLFKQEEEGLCPCCKSAQETTIHVFQCLAPEVVTHRDKQLLQFTEFLDEQELPKPVKQCIHAGMTTWLDSAMEKPALHAPTRGRLMPADQMATQAFVAQTTIGWDAFLRGQISHLWRKAILFSSPVRDEDAAETHLRRLIKKLHSFSLSMWECRNGIIQGNTQETRRAIRSATIRDKVKEAYTLYSEGKILLLPRDETLFERKILGMRLKGDDDTLLCWLRSLEVAINACEKQQSKAAKLAAVFFQPFRELGRQKLAERRLTMLQSQIEETKSFSEQRSVVNPEEEPYSQRETDQMETEVSDFTKSQYNLRRQKAIVVEGLGDTFFCNELDEEEQPGWYEMRSEDSIVSPGPFHAATVLEQTFSSDSSYIQSRRRDIAYSFDTFTTSSATIPTPEGYRAERRIAQMDHIDHLAEGIERMNQGTPQDEDSTFQPDTLGAQLPTDSDTSEDNTEQNWIVDKSHIGSLTAQQMLRFPLHRIMDEAPISSEADFFGSMAESPVLPETRDRSIFLIRGRIP